MSLKSALVASAFAALTLPAAAQIAIPTTLPPPATLPAPAAYPVFFDDFFSDNLGQPAQNFNGFIQWNVTGGSVDFVGGNVLGAQGGPPDGRYVELGGSTGVPGRFATRSNIQFLPGIDYTLSFAYLSTGNELNSATATIGDRTFTVTTSDPTQYSVFSQTFRFDTPTQTTLAFQDAGLGNPNDGIGIDFVFVRPAGTPETILANPTPEPATMAALGVGALAFLRRRRRA